MIPPDRLDSWKALADYLGRDVRTLQRWEVMGLPVRRLPGARGHSVFAFRSEVDAWMAAGGPKGTVAPAEMVRPVPDDDTAMAESAQPASAPRSGGPLGRWSARGWSRAAGIVVLVGLGTWRVWTPGAAEQLAVEVGEHGVVARDLAGVARWRWTFPADQQAVMSSMGATADVIGGDNPHVLVVTAHALDRASHQPINGAVRQFSMDGQLRRTFSIGDEWVFGNSRGFAPPWAMTGAHAETSDGRTRIAVAAHHYTWWPSVVTVLNERWHREASFVNSGWVESVRWLSPARLMIAGFSQSRDGGMVALLDGASIDGSSPEAEGPFRCRNCPAGAPLAYVVMPRSELNLVTGSEFNRAMIDYSSGNVIVRTSEVERPKRDGALVGAIYEFSPSLELVRADYGSLYWDRHRVLELEGTLHHTRDECPEKNGPPIIHMWDRARGWRTIRTHQ